jgi:hypothetical protein
MDRTKPRRLTGGASVFSFTPDFLFDMKFVMGAGTSFRGDR